MHVEWPSLIGELCEGQTTKCGCSVHDGQEPEGLQRLVANSLRYCLSNTRAVARSKTSDGSPLSSVNYCILLRVICTYLFEVEEDWIEAEEHESYSGSEPAPGLVVECICVEPGADLEPALWLVELVGWVWCGKDEGVNTSYGGQCGNVSNCVVKANCLNEIAQHSRVDDARNTGTACNVPYSESSSLGKPGSSDCKPVSKDLIEFQIIPTYPVS